MEEKPEQVVSLDDYKKRWKRTPEGPRDPYIHVQRSPSGEVSYQFDVRADESIAFMSACLVVCASLLAKLP
jgi:hypothetical protein